MPKNIKYEVISLTNNPPIKKLIKLLLFFIDKYWPDFTLIDLEKIISQFNNRNRRYGGL